MGVTLCSIEKIFDRADVISLDAPLLPETSGMIIGSHFQSMKENASFINTARGEIVKEGEMIEVLKQREDITAVIGTLGWGEVAKPLHSDYHVTEDYEFAESGHTGYWRLPSPGYVSRKVIYKPSSYWLVLDCFESNGEHDYTQHFHFPENTPLRWKNNQFITNYNDHNNISVIPFNEPDTASIKEGYIARHYNEMEKHPHAELTYKKRNTAALPFMILPFENNQSRCEITRLPVFHINGKEKDDSEAVAFEVNINRDKDIVVYSLGGQSQLNC